MKTHQHSYFKFASVLLSLCLLASNVAAFAPKGQKNYKQGLQYEAAQQWEKAAEEFSLAVAADPANSEYQLHYRRAVFNASQAFVQPTTSASAQGDSPRAEGRTSRLHSARITILSTMLADTKGLGEWGFAALVEAFHVQAADPGLSLSWFDAVVLSQKAEEQARNQPKPAAPKARF